MRKQNIIAVVITFLFLVGCTKVIKPIVIDQTGRQLPSPHYVLYSTQDKVAAVFYYAEIAGKKDLDGTIQTKPTFLDMNKKYRFNSKTPTDVILVIEISNPKEIEYHLWEINTQIDRKGGKTINGALLAKSNLRYRQYSFKMPINDDLKEVLYGINLEDKNSNVLIHFGDFHYEIK